MPFCRLTLFKNLFVQKAIEKINKGEDLRVYVVIPMYPEGDPASKPVQEILHWQHRTMQMMYKSIAAAIEANELDTDKGYRATAIA